MDKNESQLKLIKYWAEHGLDLQKSHPNEFLVLVCESDVIPECFTEGEEAIKKAESMGFKALYIGNLTKSDESI